MRLIAAVREWWGREPEFTDEMLETPLSASGVAKEMAAVAAKATHLDERLDLTLESVDVADELLRSRPTPVDLYVLGAYIGELLRAAAPSLEWALEPRAPHDPVLAVGKQTVNPFDLAEQRTQRRHRQSTLTGQVEDLVAYAHDPTEATTKRLGWTLQLGATHWDQLRENWRRRRRQRTRRLVRRLTSQP